MEKAVYDGSNTVRRLQRFTERERDPKAAASTIDIEEAVKDVVELTRPRWKNLMERSGRTIDIQDGPRAELPCRNQCIRPEGNPDQSSSQCYRRNAPGGCRHLPVLLSGRAGFPRGQRHRYRHEQGCRGKNIRSLFYHEGNRKLRPWVERLMEPHQPLWRRHPGKEQAGQRHHFHHQAHQGGSSKGAGRFENRRRVKFLSLAAGRRRTWRS